LWRADASRSDTGVHCGLGLALVDQLIKGLGGTIRCQVEKDEIFVVRLVIPAG